MRKLHARRLAKCYVIALLTHQDEPEWATNVGLDPEERGEFREELYRIANRMEARLPERYHAKPDGSPPTVAVTSDVTQKDDK